MLKPFMFVIQCVPTPENKHFTAVSGAFAHIWVIDGEQEAALLRALSFLKDQKWDPKDVQHAFEILPEQILDLGEEETALYQRALLQGLAADFLAY